MNQFEIKDGFRAFEDFEKILSSQSTKIQISEQLRSKIVSNRNYLDDKIAKPEEVHYGINTGFGSLCNIQISADQLGKLQENLVLSHACGMGERLHPELCRIILALKINNLAYGYSGIHLDTMEALVHLYNQGLFPVIYEQGSLGASGDLAPLAHLSLPLLGRGQVYRGGEIKNVEELSLTTIKLRAKEGLALLNGTQFSLAHALVMVSEGFKLFDFANHVAGMSIDAYRCDYAPYHYLLHDIRPHQGQRLVAATLTEILQGSQMPKDKVSVQDPYSFRCIPQVHGASYHALLHAKEIVTTELNSVTDNPNIFAEHDLILSGGNFHAQPLALILDYLAIALSELASISERRIYQLINGDRGLPPFLTAEPGLNSGFMIAQYTAASIVSQNKQLCSPASVDSIVSSKGQEDHVSMAANAATKGIKVLKNLKQVLAVELMVSAQALSFRRPHQSSPKIEKIYQDYRKCVPSLGQDRLLKSDMDQSVRFINELYQLLDI